MRFEHSFDFEAPLARTWDLLTDVRRVAPAMPGAELSEIRDDEFVGAFKVKIGPVLASYDARAHFDTIDVSRHHLALKATGSDRRGLGGFAATVTADLSDKGGDRTDAHLVTDLSLTGRVAQFGTGMVEGVSAKLLNTFIANLHSQLAAEPARADPVAAGTVPSIPASASDAASRGGRPADAIDIGRLMTGSLPSPTTLWLCTMSFVAGWVMARRASSV